MRPFIKYKLSLGQIRFLLIYYFTTCIVGVIIVSITLVLCLKTIAHIPILALIGGFGSAIAGSTIFYIRKLYKLCIRGEIELSNNQKKQSIELGFFLYFLARPLFSIVFSLFIYICLISSISLITSENMHFGKGLIYLNVFLSFLTGFSSGDFITLLEEKSKKIIQNKIPIE